VRENPHFVRISLPRDRGDRCRLASEKIQEQPWSDFNADSEGMRNFGSASGIRAKNQEQMQE
jgi:hypothetical protein